MNHDNQKLWDLLDSTTRPSAPPFFATRVMDRIEDIECDCADWFSVVLRWFAPATVSALFIAALFPSTFEDVDYSFSGANEVGALDIVQIVSPEDYVVLTSFDWPDPIDP